MGLFSERHGYTKPSDVIIREQITPEIQNVICNCYDKFQNIALNDGYDDLYEHMTKEVWTIFLNQREANFKHSSFFISKYITDIDIIWYSKLDLIEFSIKYLYKLAEYLEDLDITFMTKELIDLLNKEFKRLNFVYRIINKEVTEITSKEEIITIEEALKNNKNNSTVHLNKALELYSQKPVEEYLNSIKESISAVEVYCREKTGESTLGKALNRLESRGAIIPPLLKAAFDKLYAYTNQSNTGIRHALMDNEDTYVPQAEEALFMLVSCSAFINYLNKKVRLQ